jgi:hypothetical protein
LGRSTVRIGAMPVSIPGMSVLGRHLLLRATSCTLSALLLLFPLAFILALDETAINKNPLLALDPALAIATATVLSTPLVFAISAAVGTVIFHAKLLEDGETLTALLSGRSPWQCLCWPLVPAGILSASALFLMIDIHPAANRVVRGTSWLQAQQIPELLALVNSSPHFDHLAYSGTPGPDGGIADMRLLLRQPQGAPLLLAAEHARFEETDQGEIRIHLTAGIASAGGANSPQVYFEKAQAKTSVEGLVATRQRTWQNPGTRSFRTLSRDVEIAEMVVGQTARKMSNRYRFERRFRLIIGLLPLLLSVQLIVSQIALGAVSRNRLETFLILLWITVLTAWLLATSRSVAKELPVLANCFLAASTCAPMAVAWVWSRLRPLRS